MSVRRAMQPLLFGVTVAMFAAVGGMMLYCIFHDNLHIHVATLAILTTSGPLIARVFEGLVRRRQRLRDLDMNSLAADDEILFSRTVPLLMPIAGAAFAYWVMM